LNGPVDVTILLAVTVRAFQGHPLAGCRRRFPEPVQVGPPAAFSLPAVAVNTLATGLD
jgi:hypothetical protein